MRHTESNLRALKEKRKCEMNFRLLLVRNAFYRVVASDVLLSRFRNLQL